MIFLKISEILPVILSSFGVRGNIRTNEALSLVLRCPRSPFCRRTFKMRRLVMLQHGIWVMSSLSWILFSWWFCTSKRSRIGRNTLLLRMRLKTTMEYRNGAKRWLAIMPGIKDLWKIEMEPNLVLPSCQVRTESMSSGIPRQALFSVELSNKNEGKCQEAFGKI